MRQQVIHLLEKEIDLEHIPGAVIHVSHKGELVLEEALGYRSVYPEKLKMEQETVFDLASLTKVVATLPAVLKLIDRGNIRLDDKVQKFIRGFDKGDKQDITIRHLLTHTSGLIAHHPFYEENLSGEQILEWIYTNEAKEQVGSKVVYSDLGFITLYKIIETVTKNNFAQFIDEEIFQPLGMNETVFNPTFSTNRYAATEYCEKRKDYKRGIVHDENAEAMDGISGHAGLFSTIADLRKFALMTENGGIYNGKRIISNVAIDISSRNYTPDEGESRGLGWILKSITSSSCGDYFSNESYGHTGFTGTSIWFDPTVHLHVILLTNRVHFGRTNHLIQLRPRLHNLIRSYF